MLEEFGAELLLIAGLVSPDGTLEDGKETYYWTVRAFRLCDAFWRQFCDWTLYGEEKT